MYSSDNIIYVILSEPFLINEITKIFPILLRILVLQSSRCIMVNTFTTKTEKSTIPSKRSIP